MLDPADADPKHGTKPTRDYFSIKQEPRVPPSPRKAYLLKVAWTSAGEDPPEALGNGRRPRKNPYPLIIKPTQKTLFFFKVRKQTAEGQINM